MPVTYPETLAELHLDGTPVVLLASDRLLPRLPLYVFTLRAAPGVRGLRARVAAHLLLWQDGDGYRQACAAYRLAGHRDRPLGPRQAAWGALLCQQLTHWVGAWLAQAGWQYQAASGAAAGRWLPGSGKRERVDGEKSGE
ncbi:MAG: hypothetical protein KatS3mg131_0149 [Candidatus Tectimicrobiota bacterium]|nr:MAG: hypothetical protein KatS3mg131_0149 [Candidatus Tectomicrobia bacterium]